MANKRSRKQLNGKSFILFNFPKMQTKKKINHTEKTDKEVNLSRGWNAANIIKSFNVQLGKKEIPTKWKGILALNLKWIDLKVSVEQALLKLQFVVGAFPVCVCVCVAGFVVWFLFSFVGVVFHFLDCAYPWISAMFIFQLHSVWYDEIVKRTKKNISFLSGFICW